MPVGESSWDGDRSLLCSGSQTSEANGERGLVSTHFGPWHPLWPLASPHPQGGGGTQPPSGCHSRAKESQTRPCQSLGTLVPWQGGQQGRGIPNQTLPESGTLLPWQGGQQAAGSRAGSEQEWGHSLFSQLTSPSWHPGVKVGVSHTPHIPTRIPSHICYWYGQPMGMGTL